MAKPTTLPFSKLLILIGDGATPTEAFEAPCGLTTKNFELSANSNEVQVPDCDDPDAPAWIERVVATLQGTVTGNGVMAVESFPVWQDWALSGQPKNARIQLDEPAMGYYSGSFILSSFALNAELGDKVQIDITLDSDGQIIWTAVP
jgi:predicted secreted protein